MKDVSILISNYIINRPYYAGAGIADVILTKMFGQISVPLTRVIYIQLCDPIEVQIEMGVFL